MTRFGLALSLFILSGAVAATPAKAMIGDKDIPRLVSFGGACAKCDLSGRRLTNARFSGANFAGASLVNADLRGASFIHSSFQGARLMNACVAAGVAPADIPSQLTRWTGINSMVQNFGAFFGIYGFSLVSQRIGRRPAFAISLVSAMTCTAATFWFLRDFKDIFIFVPLMGFTTLSLFGGYAIYFPELFPTRLRSTGTSFCYNVGRFIAAAGPAALGILSGVVYKDTSEPLRYAGITMCAIYVVGLAALPFAPETKGQPLPEEEKGFAH